MDVTKFAEIVPPPPGPHRTYSLEDWIKVESELGLIYPEEFRSFVDLYGDGLLFEFLRIFSPFSPYFRDMVDGMLDAYHYLSERHPLDYRFEILPKKPGIFPLARSVTGYECYWLVGEDSVPRNIVVYQPRSSVYSLYRANLLSLIADWVNQEDEVFGYDWLEADIKFEKYI